jgi:rubrerythrin
MLSKTLQNLSSALAGESTAHIKYRYFAKIARDEGYEDIAKHFEHTADQEIKHAWGHLELLIGRPSTRECLLKAIEDAEQEGNESAILEARLQAEESKQHAQEFSEMLSKAEARFAALAKVEERHANAYKKVLESM